MDITSGSTPLYRFAGFEFQASTGELRCQGRTHLLPEQACRVLQALLKADGELVSREELRTTLWPGRSFGDFEGGLNTAICKLRQALDDVGSEPHIIGTLPRHGYRMLVPVENGTSTGRMGSRLGRPHRWNEVGVPGNVEIPELIYRVAVQGPELVFPPPHAMKPGRTNLPEELTSFIGREKELSEVGTLMGASRLVTLTGPGGVGKTRLALRVAASCGDRFGDGRWLVELAVLTDARDLPSALCRVLGLKQSAGSAPMDHLIEYLSARTMLVILDNCEHLIDACAGMAEQLLRACPGLSLLATSREPLGLPGEATYRVPPLAVSEGVSTLPGMLACDAVRLFLERAQSTSPDFAVGDADIPLITRICAQLDGIPLALELAAAKVRYYALPDLAALLADRFGFLATGSRTAPSRQRTLRALIDWSWDLLDEAERLALARLSVFRAPFDMADASGVAGPGCVVLLERLIAKSLVSLEVREGASLYSILETLREYAAEKLRERGGEMVAHEALADRCLTFLLETRKKLRGPGFHDAMRDFVLRAPTLDACIDRCIATGDPRSLALAGVAGMIRLVRSDYARVLQQCEGALAAVAGADQAAGAVDALEAAARARLSSLLDAEGAFALAERAEAAACGHDLLLARALNLKGVIITNGHYPVHQGSSLAKRQGLEDGENHFRKALDISNRIGDHESMGRALLGLGIILRLSGDLGRSLALYEEALSVFRAVGDPVGTLSVFHTLPYTYLQHREFAKARQAAAEGLDAAAAVDDPYVAAFLRYVLGAVAVTEMDADPGALDEARRLFRIILETGRNLGRYSTTRLGIINLIRVIAIQGHTEECEALLRERITERRCRGNPAEAHMTLGHAAFFFWAKGEVALSAFYFGASSPDLVPAILKIGADPSDEATTKWLDRNLRGSLGDERYEKAYAKGLQEGPRKALASLETWFPGCAALAASVPSLP